MRSCYYLEPRVHFMTPSKLLASAADDITAFPLPKIVSREKRKYWIYTSYKLKNTIKFPSSEGISTLQATAIMQSIH